MIFNKTLNWSNLPPWITVTLSACSSYITNFQWILLNGMFYLWIQCLVQVGFACYSVSVHCLFELKEFDLGCELVLVKTKNTFKLRICIYKSFGPWIILIQYHWRTNGRAVREVQSVNWESRLLAYPTSVKSYALVNWLFLVISINKAWCYPLKFKECLLLFLVDDYCFIASLYLSGYEQMEEVHLTLLGIDMLRYCFVGNSANQAIDLLIRKGVPEDRIIFLNLISVCLFAHRMILLLVISFLVAWHLLLWEQAPEGIQCVCKRFPLVKIVTSEIDYGLNEEFRVIPGLGEYGDRYFGTDNWWFMPPSNLTWSLERDGTLDVMFTVEGCSCV